MTTWKRPGSLRTLKSGPPFSTVSPLFAQERESPLQATGGLGFLPEQPNLIQTQCGFRNWKQQCYRCFILPAQRREELLPWEKAFQMYFETML